MTDPMLPLPGLSLVCGKAIEARFDGGLLSSDGGVLALREAEKVFEDRAGRALHVLNVPTRKDIDILSGSTT